MAREQAALTHDLCYVTKTEDWGLCNLVYVKVFSLSLGIGVVGLRHGLYNATVVRVTYVLRVVEKQVCSHTAYRLLHLGPDYFKGLNS